MQTLPEVIPPMWPTGKRLESRLGVRRTPMKAPAMTRAAGHSIAMLTVSVRSATPSTPALSPGGSRVIEEASPHRRRHSLSPRHDCHHGLRQKLLLRPPPRETGRGSFTSAVWIPIAILATERARTARFGWLPTVACHDAGRHAPFREALSFRIHPRPGLASGVSPRWSASLVTNCAHALLLRLQGEYINRPPAGQAQPSTIFEHELNPERKCGPSDTSLS